MNLNFQEFYRGEIYYADTGPAFRPSIQPVLILLTDQGIYDSPTVVVAEARHTARTLFQPTHVVLEDIEGLPGRLLFQLEALHSIDKRRLLRKAGNLTARQMEEIDAALRTGLYLGDDNYLPTEVEAP